MGIMEALLSFIRRQVGLRGDAADAEGSLHAKINKILYDIDNMKLTKRRATVIPSNTLRASANQERTSIRDDSYFMLKEIQVFVLGTVRVSYEIKKSGPSGVYGKIYINGNEVGIPGEADGSTETYKTVTGNIPVKENDLVQLYVRASRANGDTTGYWRNFRLYYDYPAAETAVIRD